MARVGFTGLPPEGAKNDRDVARVVNSNLSGKTNNVFDITFTGQEIADGNFTVRVLNLLVSDQSIITAEPKSINAAIQPVIIIEQGKGFFDIAFGDPNAPLGFGQGQTFVDVSFTQDVQAGIFEQVTDTNFFVQGRQLNVTHSNGVLTISRAGTYAISAVCSLGLVPIGNNNTITFGGIKNNSLTDAFGTDWTRRSNATGVPMAFSAYVDFAAGDNFAAGVRVDANDTVEFDNVGVSIFSIGASIPLPLLPADTFDYRFVVVG